MASRVSRHSVPVVRRRANQAGAGASEVLVLRPLPPLLPRHRAVQAVRALRSANAQGRLVGNARCRTAETLDLLQDQLANHN